MAKIKIRHFPDPIWHFGQINDWPEIIKRIIEGSLVGKGCLKSLSSKIGITNE